MSDNPSHLEQIQRWMQERISHPDGVASGDGAPEIDQIVRPSRQMSAKQRLQVYHDSDFVRLIDVMAEEYPTTRQVTGQERFTQLCHEYVITHPPTSWTLADLSIHFPNFLREQASQVPHRELVTDIARVERAMEDIFDAPTKTPIGVHDMLAIPLDSWPSVRLELSPALALFELGHPVNAVITAVREGRSMQLPRPKPSWIAVWRKNHTVWRKQLDSQAQYQLLSEIRDGRTLGEALDVSATLPGIDLEQLITELRAWFEEWAREAWFCSLRSPSSC